MSQIPIVTRRELLGRGLGLVGVGSALPNFLVRSALAGPEAESNQRIVVSLLMTGGHDGLSGVPPYAHEDYYRYRKVTRIEEKDVIKLNDEVGLHPNLAGFRDLLDERAFAVVLGTGYPNPDLSHFVSRDIWEAGERGARTGRPGSLGWLGRYLDTTLPNEVDPALSIAIGRGRLPLVVSGSKHPGMGFSDAESLRYRGARSDRDRMAYERLQGSNTALPAESDLQFVTRTAVGTNAASMRILDHLARYKTDVTYPDTEFGQSLRTIAALIGQGMTTRVYYAAQGIARFGGYDTHAEQKPRHGQLVDELCQSVGAFYKDLKRQGNADRVLTFTFSEFGRRVPENHSGGTDHGTAGPMFLFGPGVKPGVHGTQPSLKELENYSDIAGPDNFHGSGNLKMHVDFRSVYRAILERWLDTPSQSVLGAEYPLLDCIRDQATG